MSWSIPIIRVAGIQLRIHVTFLLLIGWIALGSGSAVIFVLLLFLCVVLQEFSVLLCQYKISPELVTECSHVVKPAR